MKLEVGSTYIIQQRTTGISSKFPMKIRILDLTETTIQWRNLDSTNYEHSCRQLRNSFENEFKIIEELGSDLLLRVLLGKTC